MNRLLISSVSALALVAGAAQAEAQELLAEDEGSEITTLELISVTANRTPTERSKVGSVVEQVTQQEIEERSLTSVSDYLTLLPGVSFTSNGGLGTASNSFMRGLPGGYVKTLYNGIDISDVTGIQVQTKYQYLQTGGLAGIEVLKGSQSTLYGSNVIAGLVDITTLGEITEGVHHTLQAEAGSFGTVRGRYGFAAARENSKVSVNISGIRTDGISALAGGSERDGYENVTFDLSAEHRINEAFSVFGSLLYIDAKAEFDSEIWDFENSVSIPAPNDAESHETALMKAGRVGFNLDLMDGRLKNTFSMQSFESERNSISGGFTSSFVSSRQKLDYQGAFEATDWLLLQYGIDHEQQEAEDAGGGSRLGKVDLTGIWTQTILEPIENLTLTAGVRRDEHSMFGGHTTWRSTASYLFDRSGTRLHSSYGTGFRAPSLYELYGPGNTGNPDLRPETSQSFDIGIEQQFLGSRVTADLTYFYLKVDNLIQWVPSNAASYPWGGYYDQVPGTTISQGAELSFTYAASHWLDLGGSYTYTDSKVPGGTRRSSVPRHMAVLSATARPADKWTLSGDLKFVADTIDSSGDLNDYVLLNAKVTYQINDSTEIYLRGENLLDQDYEVVRGYNTPGIAAYAGFKAKF